MRTVNRMPVSVPAPSSSDVAQRIFNHLNWKGLSDDSNFITVDQETFKDCNNIYLDTKGVLKSRPPVKSYANINLQNIVDIEQYDDLIVVITSGNKYNFVQDGEVKTAVILTERAKIVFIERRIYLFTSTSIHYYDLDSFIVHDAKDLVYIPITKINSAGTITQSEQPNELTSKQITQYLYSRDIPVDFMQLIGESMVVTIDNTQYELTYIEGLEKAFVEKYSILPSSTMGVCVSERLSMIRYTDTSIYYSATGLLFTMLPDPGTYYGKPVLSDDGTTVAIFKSDGLYRISVVESGSYPTWTKLAYAADETLVTTLMTPYCRMYTEDLYAYIYSASGGQRVVANYTGEADVSTIFTGPTITGTPILTFTTYRGQENLLSLVYVDGSVEGNPTHLAEFVLQLNGTMDGETPVLLIDDDNNNIDTATENCGLAILPSVTEDDELMFTTGIIAATDNGTIKWEASLTLNTSPPTSSTQDLLIIPLSEYKHTKYILSSYDNSVLTNTHLYYGSNIIPLLFMSTPLYNEGILYCRANDTIYTSSIATPITIDITSEGEVLYKKFAHSSVLDNTFLAEGNNLYISQLMYNDDDGELLLYLPKINTHKFSYKITNLHPLSKTEMGIFFENEIQYATITDYGYLYTKSRINAGCKQGADVITSYDGKYIFFSTIRGLVAMAYQEDVATTEQTLVYLSDNIQDTYNSFGSGIIKLFMYKFWLVCYKQDSNIVYMYDLRNGSWWKWSYTNTIGQLIYIDEDVVILSNEKLYYLNNDGTYYDGNNVIEWHFTSQMLHLSAPNNYKHIYGIHISSISDVYSNFTCSLEIKNYRRTSDEKTAKLITYDIDDIRTYVKKLNFAKVNNFQYTLRNDKDNKQPTQLTLTSISVRYGIKDQVK